MSFDAKTIAFAWNSEEERCWHIFKVNVGGSNLVQLTDGKNARGELAYKDSSQNDFDPCFLPNGRIAFVSERRSGYLRCSPGRPCPTFTLFSMKDDGSDVIPLSYHETNEWHPSVNNDGMIVYTRWDYLDRDDMIAHHIWTCCPDGRDPRSFHGNYPPPYDTFDEPGFRFPVKARGGIVDYDGRFARPIGEWNIRAIPGSHKYVATAAGHHSRSFGSLVMIDPRIVDDNGIAQLTGITSQQPTQRDRGGPYGTPWPLSEELFLCSFNKDLVALDRFGNRDVIYSAGSLSADKIIDPIPLIPRDPPPVIPTRTHQGENLNDESPNATISIMNAYIADIPLPRGVKIKWLRVVQVIPQLQARMNTPSIGYATESLARVPLGVVPVEEDGSVYFKAPVEKEIYFQLLDENGLAVHSMRSGTYVHPGEQMSCLGCHEDKSKSPPPNPNPLALQRPPSELRPEVSQGAIPYNWHLLTVTVMGVAGSAAAQNVNSTEGEKSVKELREDFRKLEFGMFICFNMATFTGEEWVTGYPDPSIFSPGSKVDTDAWADAAVSAGMKYGVLTTKHVSGFCLWDSKYTTYDVMHPDCPYKKDVVAQFVKSFTSRGLKVGFHYHWRHPGFRDPNKHKVLPPECDPAKHMLEEQNEFQKKQIAELLENYPEVFYFWNDALDDKVMPAEEILLSPAQLMPGCQRQLACRCPESQGRTSRPWHPSDHWQRRGQ